jgi:hypothetical protein
MKALALCKSQQIKAAKEKKNWKVTIISDHILQEKTLPSI